MFLKRFLSRHPASPAVVRNGTAEVAVVRIPSGFVLSEVAFAASEEEDGGDSELLCASDSSLPLFTGKFYIIFRTSLTEKSTVLCTIYISERWRYIRPNEVIMSGIVNEPSPKVEAASV